MDQDLTPIFQQLDLSVGIGETSRVTGATLTQIRYWEKKGYIHSFTPESSRNKRFDLPNIMRIIQIHRLLDEGFTLAKASAMITEHRHQIDRLKLFMRQNIHRVWEKDDVTYFDLGVIQNDPDYRFQIKITDNQSIVTKVPRETDH